MSNYQILYIMNTPKTLAIILTSGLLLTGCTSDDAIQVETLREVSATLNGFNQDESITRTAYNISETSGFQTVWAAGDVLGIYPIGGDQVSFPISDGVGTTTAKFDGGSWALRGTYKYAAYYPFSKDCYTIDQTAIPVSLLGQVQTGSNTTAHLAAYDFMAAAGTQPSANGSVDLQFNHVGCFLRMQFTMPKAGTYTSVNIETDGGSFTTKGTVTLAATIPALTATATSNKLTLGLNNVNTTTANQTIILYMMVAPDNLSTHTLTFTVEDNAGNTYTKTAAGKNMIATYAYNYSLVLEATGTGGATGGGEWGGEPTMHNGHEYVDLGFKDEQGRNIYWATCNIGAENPEDYGLYFAWGETEGHKIDDIQTDGYSFDWSTAPFNNGSSSYDNRYFNSIKNEICPNDILTSKYDVAQVNWQGYWRIPTYDELNWLIDNCTWIWDSAKSGYTITSEITSQSIFLPAAGVCYLSSFGYLSLFGCYWSSSLDTENQFLAYYLLFNSSSRCMDSFDRCGGHSVRPVCILSD